VVVHALEHRAICIGEHVVLLQSLANDAVELNATVLYADLEEKSQPMFAAGPTLQANIPQQQVVAPPRGAFQGVGMTAM